MTDVVPAEIKDAVVEKDVEKSKVEDLKSKVAAETVKNGDDKKEEETENGDSEKEKNDQKSENGSVKENGSLQPEEKSKDTAEVEVCGIKRKSDVGLQLEDAAVDSTEKKQKLAESQEPEVVASNGISVLQ